MLFSTIFIHSIEYLVQKEKTRRSTPTNPHSSANAAKTKSVLCRQKTKSRLICHHRYQFQTLLQILWLFLICCTQYLGNQKVDLGMCIFCIFDMVLKNCHPIADTITPAINNIIIFLERHQRL